MNDDVRIGRFRARHHVADEAGRRRAQEAQHRLLGGELEAALARAVAPQEIVLVRRLSASVVLREAGSELDDARAWGDALLVGLERLLQHAGPQDLLRFAGMSQALRAFAEDALHDRTERDWAWQRLELLPANGERRHGDAQRFRALLRLLADDPEQGLPLLRCLLLGRDWPALVARLHEDELRGLAHTVLTRLASRAVTAFDDAPVPPEDDAGALPAWWEPTRQAAVSAARTRWALRLALMLDAPSLARRGARAVDAQLRAWSATTGGDDAEERAAMRHGKTAAADTSASALHPSARDRTAGAQTVPEGGALRGPAPPDPMRRRIEPDAATSETQAEPGRTRFGGLLLLAPVLPRVGALALLEDPALWPEPPQALHALAQQLWPMQSNDPAALAFCGFLPGQPAPPPLPPTALRQTCLQDIRDRLLAHLAERLPDWAGPALLARVVCRDALITADPGWIDVQFDLRDVSTELRRAALDLDPGFLPWLGLVLRYRYE